MEGLRYMLDTNMASYIIRGDFPTIQDQLRAIPMASLCISSITEAELLHGVAKKPTAKQLPIVVKEFLLRVTILPWGDDAAEAYAELRAASEKEGLSLGTMDMLIAAHAVAIGAILITHDQAFYRLEHYLTLQDWTKPVSS